MAVTIPIISEFDGKGIKSAVAEFKQLEGAGAKAQFALKKAAVPAAAALAALGAAATVATKAAVEDLKAQELLAQALRNTTNATDAQIAANEQFIAATERAAAVSDEQLRPALGNLVRATGDVEEAQKLLAVALDISAATGSDLESVSIALSKAANGQVTALQRLGIPLDENAVKAKDFNAILGQLSDTFGGAASASANSYEGQMRRVAIAIDNTKENIGMALIPVVERLLPVLDKAALFVQNNTGLIVGMGIAVATLSGLILALNTAIKIATVAQVAFNLAMTANPIGLVITAIAAIIGSFGLLIKMTGSVVNAFKYMGNSIIMVFEGIANSFNFMLNGIVSAINLIPGVNIPLIPKVVLPKFSWSVGGDSAGGSTPSVPGGMGGPDLLERGLRVPTIPTPTVPTIPTPSGGGGGRVPRAGEVSILPIGAPDYRGVIRPDDPRLEDFTPGELARMNNQVINVTVNTVTAPSDLGDTIVDALKDYTRRSGPLDLAIAI